MRALWVVPFLAACWWPAPCRGQASDKETPDDTEHWITAYGGVVLLDGRFQPEIVLFTIGGQLSIRRPHAEWVIAEAFGMVGVGGGGAGIEGGLATAFNITPVVGGPYVGVGGARLSPVRGGPGFVTGRVGLGPDLNGVLRLEVQFFHDVSHDGFPDFVAINVGLALQ